MSRGLSSCSNNSITNETLSNKGENDFENIIDKLDEEHHFRPFHYPAPADSLLNKLKFYSSWPLMTAFYYTMPNCRRQDSQKYYMITFVISLVWLSLLSYIMVWMITVVGYTFLIPDTVMGITLIAFGASGELLFFVVSY